MYLCKFKKNAQTQCLFQAFYNPHFGKCTADHSKRTRAPLLERSGIHFPQPCTPVHTPHNPHPKAPSPCPAATSVGTNMQRAHNAALPDRTNVRFPRRTDS